MVAHDAYNHDEEGARGRGTYTSMSFAVVEVVHDDILNAQAEEIYDSPPEEERVRTYRDSGLEAAARPYGARGAYRAASSAEEQKNGGRKGVRKQGACVVCHSRVGSTSAVVPQ